MEIVTAQELAKEENITSKEYANHLESILNNEVYYISGKIDEKYLHLQDLSQSLKEIQNKIESIGNSINELEEKRECFNNILMNL